MYCFIIICWLVLANAAAILGTLSCHGMYCFIIIYWLLLGNAEAILKLCLVMECIDLLLFVVLYGLMQQLYWEHSVLSWNVLFYYYLLAGTG